MNGSNTQLSSRRRETRRLLFLDSVDFLFSITVWLGLDNTTTWLGLGKGHGLDKYRPFHNFNHLLE